MTHEINLTNGAWTAYEHRGGFVEQVGLSLN